MRTDRGEVFRYDIDDDRWSTIASGTIEGGAPYSVDFTDDGRYLHLGAHDGVGLVDVEAGEAVGSVIPTETPSNGGHGGTGRTGSGDRGLRQHDRVADRARDVSDLACLAAGRNVTREA